MRCEQPVELSPQKAVPCGQAVDGWCTTKEEMMCRPCHEESGCDCAFPEEEPQ